MSSSSPSTVDELDVSPVERLRTDQRYADLHNHSEPVRHPPRAVVGREAEVMQILASMSREEVPNALLLGDAGSGKLLPLETPIPTPEGWTTMGELEVGSKVLGRDGLPTTVVFVSDVEAEPELFDITFSDGSVVTACADHQWSMFTTEDRHRADAPIELEERVLTTREMFETGVVSHHHRRYSTPVTRPLDLPEVDLLVDPYTLGAWLGDGDSQFKNQARLTSMDGGVVSEIVKGGYDLTWIHCGDHDNRSVRLGFASLGSDLQELGLGSGKRIPPTYLRASFEQRLALLQGLMDTDGSIDTHGSCELTLSDETLARDAEELIRTLGISVRRCEGTSGYRNADGELVRCKTRHRMVFTTTLPVFRLQRKLDRIPQEVRLTQGLLYVVDIQPTTSRPGRCIQVDNADSMYLCGPGFTPTHNTTLVQAVRVEDPQRFYLEIKLGSIPSESMAQRLGAIFDQAEEFVVNEGIELVLFIDEVHQIVQHSQVATETLKPLLALAGTRGIRVLAATTYSEFHQFIAGNQALMERLQRINLSQPDRTTVVEILRGMAERYGVSHHFPDDNLFHLIYEFTERYNPASSQPRKSVLVLDDMLGWHRLTGREMDAHLLAEVMETNLGVNVSFAVDASGIEQDLNTHVFSQEAAVRAVTQRLQVVVADLHDKGRPMASFLFAGSTGSGKTQLTKEVARIMFGDDQRHLIRFDMSEFALETSMDLFRSEISRAVWDRPYSVILLDEIEKANSAVTRLLLQVLDDGRISNEHGRQVSFLNAIIVLTTNAGSAIFQDISRVRQDDANVHEQMKRYDKLIREQVSGSVEEGKLPPELIGRLDAMVPFVPLGPETYRRIVTSKIEAVVSEVWLKHRVNLTVTRQVLDLVVDDRADTDSTAGGARRVIALLNDELVVPVAEAINNNPGKRHLTAMVEGELFSRDKSRVKSTARVVVRPTQGR